MTNSTRLIGVIMTAVLWSGVATAQQMPGANMGDDMPPDLTLPSAGAETLPEPSTPGTGETSGAPDASTLSPESVDNYSSNQGCEPWQPNLHGLWTELRRSKAPAPGSAADSGMRRRMPSSSTACGIVKINGTRLRTRT